MHVVRKLKIKQCLHSVSEEMPVVNDGVVYKIMNASVCFPSRCCNTSITDRFQEELPAAISAREPKSITHDELVKLVCFPPQLQE